MTEKNISFYSLHDFNSVEDFLLNTFNCSKSKLKKYFDKKFLNRKVHVRMHLQLPLNFINDGLINPEYCGPEIDIIAKEGPFIALDKPGNIHVHPLTYDEHDNCLSFIREKKLADLSINRDHYDRGLLYRLDYETSGVLVYVNSDEAYHFLRENFDSVFKEKIYFARVSGKLERLGVVENYLEASEARGSKIKVVLSGSEKNKASLMIESVEYRALDDSTLVKVKLLTGMRHQIRVQLSHLGHPILGDVLYGGKVASRLYLHAYEYQFSYLNKGYKFTSEPRDFI